MQSTDIRRPSSIRRLRSASYAATKICKIRSRLRSRGVSNAALLGHNSARLQNAYPNFALSRRWTLPLTRNDVVLANERGFYSAAPRSDRILRLQRIHFKSSTRHVARKLSRFPAQVSTAIVMETSMRSKRLQYLAWLINSLRVSGVSYHPLWKVIAGIIARKSPGVRRNLQLLIDMANESIEIPVHCPLSRTLVLCNFALSPLRYERFHRVRFSFCFFTRVTVPTDTQRMRYSTNSRQRRPDH